MRRAARSLQAQTNASSVQARVAAVKGSVEALELRVHGLVNGACPRLWLEGARNGDGARHVFEVHLAQAHGRVQPGAAQAGEHRIGDPLDPPAEDISVDLTPEVRLRAAAEDAEGGYRAADEPLHRVEQPARVEGHAFHHRPYQVRAAGFDGDVEEGGPERAVLDRRALAVEPRREDDSARAGGRGGRERAQLVVAAWRQRV